MTRFFATLALSVGLAAAVSAQNTTTTTKVETKGDDDAKVITYTGCVQTGTEKQSYVLSNVVPISQRTEVVGTSGTTATATTTTTYALIPGEKVEFEKVVGHKVEVTGVMVPGGDSKTTTTTKIDRDDAPDTKVKETVKVDDAMPHFKVTSVKNLSDKCEP